MKTTFKCTKHTLSSYSINKSLRTGRSKSQWGQQRDPFIAATVLLAIFDFPRSHAWWKEWHQVYTDVAEKANSGSTEDMILLREELIVLQSISSRTANLKWGCWPKSSFSFVTFPPPGLTAKPQVFAQYEQFQSVWPLARLAVQPPLLSSSIKPIRALGSLNPQGIFTNSLLRRRVLLHSEGLLG